MSKKKSTAKANFAKTSRQDALVVGAKLSQPFGLTARSSPS